MFYNGDIIQVGGVFNLFVRDINYLGAIGGIWYSTGAGMGLAIDGPIGYLANDDPRLLVFDMSTGDNPVELSSLPAEASNASLGVAYYNGFVYLAEGNTGIEQIDVSDPYNPVSVTTIDTPGFANDLVIVNGYAYVADGPAGLVIIGGLPGCHTCGNTVVENGETCDDGNLTNGDGCNATCTGP